MGLISRLGIIAYLTLCILPPISALEIDEKLTIRILRLSETKKTALINRGLEDGLAEGDHAKFFLTKGVIARGIVAKASPTRSIWSLYKIIDPASLTNDTSANIKISAPIRLTDDPSKMLFQIQKYDENTFHIPLAEGANDVVQENLDEVEKQDIESLNSMPNPDDIVSGVQQSKDLELFTLLHFNALRATSGFDPDGDVSVTNGDLTLSFGAEKYFPNKAVFFRKFSLMATIHIGRQESAFSTGTLGSASILEYGGGINHHFYGHPLSYNRPIGFISIGGGGGNMTESIKREASPIWINYQGASRFYFLGLGIKYFSVYGWGGRVVLDYYNRDTTYSLPEDSESQNEPLRYTKTSQGPRIRFGISYRW